MAMMLKCSCGRSVVVHARPASGRVPCPICSREILVPSSSEPARAGSSNAQRLSAPPPLPAQSRTIARPPPLPAVLTPMSPAAAVAGKAIDAGDPARESTSRFSVSTILIALNLALIVALGGYAVLGDWSATTAGKGPAPKPQPVPDEGRALQPGHAAGGRVLPISLPQPVPSASCSRSCSC